MSPRTRRVALLAFAGVILSNFPVLAADGPRLSAALSAWDVRAARAMLQKGLDGVPRRDLPQLWGTLLLLEGEPARAEEMLAHATGPEAARLRVVAKGYRDVTKDLAVAVSPSGRFEVAYRPGPDEAVLPYLMEAADAAFDDLSRRLAMTVPTPVRILVLPTFEDLSAATGLTPSQLDASGAVAACAFNRIHIVSPSRMPRGYPYADTVAHELVHYFLTIRAGDRVPLWLQRGRPRPWSRPGAARRWARCTGRCSGCWPTPWCAGGCCPFRPWGRRWPGCSGPRTRHRSSSAVTPRANSSRPLVIQGCGSA